MLEILNVTRDYTVAKPYEEVVEQLLTVVNSPFNSSRFSIFGNFVSPDPAEFIFMAKWFSIGRPILAEVASTKILTTIVRNDNDTKIKITTRTNPAILIICFTLIALFIVKLLLYQNSTDLEIAVSYLVIAVLTLLFDRFIKNILIASFERDLDLKGRIK